MNQTFNPLLGPLRVAARITGPAGVADVQLVLDTGATYTMISTAMLTKVGYDPSRSRSWTAVTTAGGAIFLPWIGLHKLTALGVDRTAIPILSHTLPPTTTADGLLGLDFFRGHVLTLDFQIGQILLT